MLVLERSSGGAIRIGDDIRIKVVRIGRNRVLLGVEAPREVAVWRDEIEPEPAVGPQPSRRDGAFHILVVEPDPRNAARIRQALPKARNIKIEEVSTGEAALELLGRWATRGGPNPNLVLLDLKLPGISGREVLRFMKSVDALRGTPVVILVGRHSKAETEWCKKAGADEVIMKAGDAADIGESISKITDILRSARDVA